MLAFFFISFLILIVIFFFASPKLSPIPYFPTNQKDIPLIIKILNLKNNQMVVDLGAGDGIFIFNSSQYAFEKKLNSIFIAVEINPFLILLMKIKRFFHPNKKNIKIIYDDIFKISLDKITQSIKNLNNLTIYLYVSPWSLEKILSNLKIKKLKKNCKQITLISYFYPIPSFKHKERIIQGKNKIYLYSF